MLTTKVLVEGGSTALNKNLKRINSTFNSLLPNQINWKPGLKIRSTVDCINHLLITNELYFKLKK